MLFVAKVAPPLKMNSNMFSTDPFFARDPYAAFDPVYRSPSSFAGGGGGRGCPFVAGLVDQVANRVTQQLAQQLSSPLLGGGQCAGGVCIDPFTQQLAQQLAQQLTLSGGLEPPFRGSTMTLDPFANRVLAQQLGGGSMMGSPMMDPFQPLMRRATVADDMLQNARATALARRGVLPSMIADTMGDTNKFNYQTVEFLSGIGEDGRLYEREERTSTDETGAKSHNVRSAIDSIGVKTSTWICPAGASEKSIPHVVSFSGSGDAKKLFEKLWRQNAPFYLAAKDEDECCAMGALEGGKAEGAAAPGAAAAMLEQAKKK